jgi:hypothetical protein
MRERITLGVMAADRPYGGFYDSYSVRSEDFGYTLILHLAKFELQSDSCEIYKNFNILKCYNSTFLYIYRSYEYLNLNHNI